MFFSCSTRKDWMIDGSLCDCQFGSKLSAHVIDWLANFRSFETKLEKKKGRGRGKGNGYKPSYLSAQHYYYTTPTYYTTAHYIHLTFFVTSSFHTLVLVQGSIQYNKTNIQRTRRSYHNLINSEIENNVE